VPELLRQVSEFDMRFVAGVASFVAMAKDSNNTLFI